MLELLFAGLLLDAAIFILVLLIYRGTGKRIQYNRLIPDKMIDAINRWIAPDPKRFKAISA